MDDLAAPPSAESRRGPPAASELAALRREAAMLRARIAELEGLAATDPLCGLWNRRAIGAILRSELSRERCGAPTSLAIVGIDATAAINASLGMAGGDAAIAGVASCIRHCVRDFDHVGRDEGDRFILVLSSCGAAQALAACERIRQFIPKQAFPCASGQAQASVSIGLACSASGPASAERLLSGAERQLYLAKAAGRGRTSVDPLTY